MQAFPFHPMRAEKRTGGSRGVVEEGGVYAVEPFNTTGESGMIENIGRPNSSNIYPGTTGLTTSRKARAKNQLKPLGAQMARKPRRAVFHPPVCRTLGVPDAEETFPDADEASLQSKWNALVKKNSSAFASWKPITFFDAKTVATLHQFEHTVHVTSGGPEILTVE